MAVQDFWVGDPHILWLTGLLATDAAQRQRSSVPGPGVKAVEQMTVVVRPLVDTGIGRTVPLGSTTTYYGPT